MGARLRTAEEEAAQLHLEREESLRSLQQRAGADSELLVRGLSWLKSCPRYGGCRALPVLQGQSFKDTRSTWSRDSSRPEHSCEAKAGQELLSLCLQPRTAQGFRRLAKPPWSSRQAGPLSCW